MNRIYTHPGQPQMQVEVILASKAPGCPTLYTLRNRYPRPIHSEIMTHRKFCLAGDAMLDFELPAGTTKGTRRVHSMSLREFADKWLNGASEGNSSRHSGKTLNGLDATRLYTAKEIAEQLGMTTHTNLNTHCRKGTIYGAFKRKGVWLAYGRYWMDWRKSTGTRRFSLRSRLSKMQIRQVNEHTGVVQTSSVKDVMVCGTKEVFRVSAGSFSVCGSKDHRIYTDSGWKRIEEIVPGQDQLITYRYGMGENANPNRHNKINGQWVQTWARQNRETVASRQANLCAKSGQPLVSSYHLHHIEPRHLRPDLAFDLNNVIAVNPDAHTDLHEVQGWQVGVPLDSVGTLVDSVLSEGVCDTYDLEIAGEFSNFFADGVVVHNSRNARSSRAVPVATMLKEIREFPFVPWHWGKNQKGMQADEECNEIVWAQDMLMPVNGYSYGHSMDWEGSEVEKTGITREDAWLIAAQRAVQAAEAFSNAGYHKQVVNRLIEPFSWIDTLITATDWKNFLHLRQHKDAEPHLIDLANLIAQAIEEAELQELSQDKWHLPYITENDRDYACFDKGFGANTNAYWDFLRKVSAARCARISYKPFDGDPSYEKELDRYYSLVTSERIHASPLEHQATPDRIDPNYPNANQWEYSFLHGNLTGWIQHRKLVPGENLPS